MVSDANERLVDIAELRWEAIGMSISILLGNLLVHQCNVRIREDNQHELQWEHGVDCFNGHSVGVHTHIGHKVNVFQEVVPNLLLIFEEFVESQWIALAVYNLDLSRVAQLGELAIVLSSVFVGVLVVALKFEPVFVAFILEKHT